MDNKVLDEAVEVANRVLCGYYDANTDDTKASPTDAMRAALLAGVKVLLGPVVAEWRDMAIAAEDRHRRQRGHDIDWSDAAKSDALDACADQLESIYATSLGEGDGR